MVDSAPRIERLMASDAAALVACFERCYGRTYANPVFYDAPALGTLIESGALRSVIARVDERIIGHTGYTIRHASARVVEAGNTVVDPAFRGGGVLARLGAALAELGSELGYVGYVHYPTTAHAIMQRRSIANGGAETGIMLAYVPEDTEYLDIDRPPGRLAATVAFQPLSKLALSDHVRSTFVPARYPFIHDLYRAAGFTRAVTAHEDRHNGPSELTVQMSSRRSLLRVEVTAFGADLAQRIEDERARARPQVMHVDVPLSSLSIDRAVEGLCRVGFCYCALLPEFAMADVLRLQWLADPIAALSSAKVENDGAKALLARIRSELQQQTDGASRHS